MDSKRRHILIGMGAGVLWAIAVLWLGWRWAVEVPPITAIALAFLPGGLVLLSMIGRLASMRFFDDGLIDGQPYPPGSAGARTQTVLSNTVEQALLAVLIWPSLTILLGARGPGVVLALGLAFAVTRLAFWLGYNAAPPLRAFGFAGGHYATVMAAFWALWLLIRSG